MKPLRACLTSAFALFALFAASAARAHELGGLPASHWHADDASSFITLAVLAGVALWLARDGR